MANFIILHGTDATPNSNWFMWLKGVLIGQGHTVWLPQLPGADSPDVAVYTSFLLSKAPFSINEQTILIGHSSGAVEALFLLQHLSENTSVKGAVLVSAFKDDLGWDSLEALFKEPFDFKVLKSHCHKFIYLHSDDDPYVPIEHAEFLAKQTNGELIKIEGQGHFNTEADPDYKRFPELLTVIQSLL